MKIWNSLSKRGGILDGNEINRRMAIINRMRGPNYTASVAHVIKAVFTAGMIPEIGVAYAHGSDTLHKIRVSVRGFDEIIDPDPDDPQETVERISIALCRCFIKAYDVRENNTKGQS